MRTYLIVILAFVISAIVITPVHSADREITLSWTLNTESDMSLYRVYQSTKRGTYTINNVVAAVDKSINKVNLILPGDGKTYFFVVTALDQSGKESLYSNEVSTRLLIFDWFFGLFSSNKSIKLAYNI